MAALSITVSGAVPAPSVPTYFSTNWAGYVLLGGPFTGVTGTFNVPGIYSSSTNTAAAEWVGIDGTGPSNPGIIQAGVAEDYVAATNLYYVHAWIELYPAPPFTIPLGNLAGSSVTVTIAAVSPGLWNVFLKNNTTGQTYSVNELYSGPATSAEWIVEAPYSTATSSVVTLAGYTPVTFTQLGVNPVVGSLARLVMVQNGITVSVPSALTSNGFTVAYGSVAPAGP
jgi:hypothetical protein